MADLATHTQSRTNMAKAIRWQIPFVSIGGTKYRIDIYDEADGSWNGITTLQAGEQPFVTDESDSDDYFESVRSQTGNLQICTAIPGGGTITLADILPANNISRPVRLINVSNSSAIEWQGFLSCEAYSQDYTAIPQILSLPLISILEAMDSVQLSPDRSAGFVRLNVAIYNAIKEIEIQSGVTCFNYINFSKAAWRIFNKYIDQTVFFTLKEYDNENSTTYIPSGLSAKEALSRFCKYMGWTAREQGAQIYLERRGEEVGMWNKSLTDFGTNFDYSQETSVDPTTAYIADMKWMGVDHQNNFKQGARSVEVVANLMKYLTDMDIPECPVGNLEAFTNDMSTTTDGVHLTSVTVNSWANKTPNFNNLCTFKYLHVDNNGYLDGTTATVAQVLTTCAINPDSIIGDTYLALNPYVGAFMARLQIGSDDELNGIYINGFTNEYKNPPSSTNHVFQIRSGVSYSLANGNLVLRCEMFPIMIGDWGHVIDYTVKQMYFCVKLGSYYWNGTAWSSSFATFKATITNWTDGEYQIPITSRITGELSIRLYANPFGTFLKDIGQSLAKDIYITSLSVSFEVDADSTTTDRGSNHYSQLLSTNFKDEIRIDTNLASSLNNQPSPSLIMDNTTDAMTTVNYNTAGGTIEARRPEKDLLDRLATYYSASRQRLELQVAHPTDAPLALLRLKGIGDGKTYTPISESRNWRMETSTLTCIEIPNE